MNRWFRGGKRTHTTTLLSIPTFHSSQYRNERDERSGVAQDINLHSYLFMVLGIIRDIGGGLDEGSDPTLPHTYLFIFFVIIRYIETGLE